MRTLLSDLSNCGIPAFTFAEMAFPKHVWTLPKGTPAQRLAHRKGGCTGDLYHAPKPLTGSGTHGIGFYLASDGAPGLRWQWCDEVGGAGTWGRRIDHTGWWCDHEGDGWKIRGVVFRLPHGRGFLAGWSMGESMSSCLDYDVYSDEAECARQADRMAEVAADAERDYQDRQRELDALEETERQRVADETADCYAI